MSKKIIILTDIVVHLIRLDICCSSMSTNYISSSRSNIQQPDVSSTMYFPDSTRRKTTLSKCSPQNHRPHNNGHHRGDNVSAHDFKPVFICLIPATTPTNHYRPNHPRISPTMATTTTCTPVIFCPCTAKQQILISSGHATPTWLTHMASLLNMNHNVNAVFNSPSNETLSVQILTSPAPIKLCKDSNAYYRPRPGVRTAKPTANPRSSGAMCGARRRR